LTPDGRVSTTPYIDTTVSLDDWTNTEKVILARRSVRVYKKKQIPEPLVRRILECGRFAPSAGNFQPWRFVVVSDANMIAEMEADIAKAWSIVSKVIDIENHPWNYDSSGNGFATICSGCLRQRKSINITPICAHHRHVIFQHDIVTLSDEWQIHTTALELEKSEAKFLAYSC
jgi:hypothetical protein